ncbi:MAG: SDR family NAD(P)-dependent oxidoreductase [Steroidobacteraceae bacterium]
MKDYQGKVAFITGGASGAGLGQAKVFAAAGCHLVLADVRPKPLAEAHAWFSERGVRVHTIQLDITDRAAYARAADEVEKVYGTPPQLLFNTAGVNTFGPVEKSTFEDFDWVMGVNLGGVVNGMLTFVPRMIAAGKGGYIVTTASVGGFQGGALAAVYCAAKAAVINLMESYHMALKAYGIGVSVLCPANIRSNIAEATFTRPASLAKTGYTVNAQTIESLRQIHSHGMDPEELARHTKAAMEANQLYIIPYPEEKERLEKHFADITNAIMPMSADPEGARKRVEALAAWAKSMSGPRGEATQQ